MDKFTAFISSPYFLLVVSLLVAGFAASGKFSVTVTQILFAIAWVVAVIGLRWLPWPVWVGLSAILAGALLIFAWWARPETLPSYVGILVQNSGPELPGAKSDVPKVQLGTTNVFFAQPDPNVPVFQFSNGGYLSIERVNGRLLVSTRITDENGNMVVELIRNEWKVAPSPQTWDRNYTADALEVKDAQGEVVLQVRLFPDRVQVQGAWWTDFGYNGWVRVFLLDGGQMTIVPKKAKPPAIKPIFQYPSDRHFGELVSQ